VPLSSPRGARNSTQRQTQQLQRTLHTRPMHPRFPIVCFFPKLQPSRSLQQSSVQHVSMHGTPGGSSRSCTMHVAGAASGTFNSRQQPVHCMSQVLLCAADAACWVRDRASPVFGRWVATGLSVACGTSWIATPAPCLLWWRLRKGLWHLSPGKMLPVTSVSASGRGDMQLSTSSSNRHVTTSACMSCTLKARDGLLLGLVGYRCGWLQQSLMAGSHHRVLDA
jgi:hypothetical protein